MKTEVILALIGVLLIILCTLGCEELRDGIKSSPGDDTDKSIISISKDDVSRNEVNSGSVVITDTDGNWGTDGLCPTRRRNNRRYTAPYSILLKRV